MRASSILKNPLFPDASEIALAHQTVFGPSSNVCAATPLEFCNILSAMAGCNVFVKRCDQSNIGSFKGNGAYFNVHQNLERKSFVCASAGNHSQGFAMACAEFKRKGVVFMPKDAPQVKINKTLEIGNGFIEVKLVEGSIDEALSQAREYAKISQSGFVHPFDDRNTIIGAGTLMHEVLGQFKDLRQNSDEISQIYFPVGGGGLGSGIACYCQGQNIKLIGVEPHNAASMTYALIRGCVEEFRNIGKDADGVAVRKVGDLNFKIFQELQVNMSVVSVKQLEYVFQMMQEEMGVTLELAGLLSVAGLLKDVNNGLFFNKADENVVLFLSGQNIDAVRAQSLTLRPGQDLGDFPSQEGLIDFTPKNHYLTRSKAVSLEQKIESQFERRS